MKRTLTIILTVAALAALLSGCGKSEAEQIAEVYSFFSEDSSIAESYNKINKVCPDRPAGLSGTNDLIDYFTMMADRCGAGSDVNIFDMGPGKGRNILFEIPGKGKEKNKVTLIAAAVDTWSDSLSTRNDDLGCIAAFEVLNAYKSLNIKTRSTIRVYLYESLGKDLGAASYAEYSKSHPDEEHQMVFLLTSDQNAPKKVFAVGEPASIFRTFAKVIPPYFEGYGEYTFERGETRAEAFPFKAPLYRYNIDRDDAVNDISAVVSLIILLN